MGLATWLSLILSVMKLLGSLATYASETRLQHESDAAALGRILSDAQKTIEKARAARNAASTRDADTSGLRQPDGFQRD
jgi:hypothetical protein